MTGSLLQLVAIGNEDYFFTGNPQITFFKQVYMRHTNFSIERLEIQNEGERSLSRSNEYVFNIDNDYGDLLYYTAFHIKLPEIYADTDYQFKWIENLGGNIIDEASIFINNQLIEKIDGEFIHISNNLKLNNNSKDVYDNCIKNFANIFNPCNNKEYPYSSTKKNINNSSKYPVINKYYSDIPTIEAQTLFIPLSFFFNRIPESFIPILLLRESKIRINIKLKSIHELYTIGYPTEILSLEAELFKCGGYTGSKIYKKTSNKYYKHESHLKNSKKSILDFVKDKDCLNDCDPTLYCYIVFLENYEKNKLKNTQIKHFITTPKKYTFRSLKYKDTIKINNNNLVKDVYIVPKRSDIAERNQWSNYTSYDNIYFNPYKVLNNTNFSDLAKYWIHRDSKEITPVDSNNSSYFMNPEIVKGLKIRLNGNIIEDLDSSNNFYNKNKYESFKNNFLKHIIMYNFSEFPLEYQPSGHINLATVDNFEIDFELKKTSIDTNKKYDFDINIYLMVYKEVIFDTNLAYTL